MFMNIINIALMIGGFYFVGQAQSLEAFFGALLIWLATNLIWISPRL